ncbi:MAG: hypothetical protein ACI9MR_001851 [Myxococcota bacterium]|jgi:hypothetical protein
MSQAQETAVEKTAASAPSATHTSAPAGRAVQLEKALTGRSFEEQSAMLAPPGPYAMAGAVQAEGNMAGDGPSIQQHAAEGVASGGGQMPHHAAVQMAFGGHDISGVRAHVGGAAAKATEAIGASAYATGNDIAFQSAPTLHTAAHEAAHVVQQRAGVSLQGGVGQAGDSYEQHADKVADAVVSGKSAEALLGPASGGGGTESVQRQVQRKGPDPSSDLGKDAATKGAKLEEMTTLSGEDGYHATEGSMAKDPNFEANAQIFEDRLGGNATNNTVAQGAAALLSESVRGVVQQWANAFKAVGEKTEATEARYHEKLSELTGTPADAKGVAGAVGNKADEILAAVSGGNMREQMTILYNFGRGFGREFLAQKGKQSEAVEAFIAGLDHREVKLGQQLERLGGKNKYLVNDSKTGEVGKQGGTRGKSEESPVSTRTVGDAKSQGVELSDREVNHMKLNPKALDAEFLTWNEGNRSWLINEADSWVQKAREASLPVKAGPSGTTDRLMQLRDMLGVSSPMATRAACVGYLLPINAHSLVEILEAASQYACPKPTYGPGLYAAIEPFQGLELLAPTAAFWKTVTAT